LARAGDVAQRAPATWFGARRRRGSARADVLGAQQRWLLPELVLTSQPLGDNHGSVSTCLRTPTLLCC